MSKRLELHEILCDAVGSRHVYYQPPESIKLEYPCIVYYKDAREYDYADDIKYRTLQSYTLTIIDKRPDTPIADKLDELKYCSFQRNYRVDNLYHEVYQIFY